MANVTARKLPMRGKRYGPVYDKRCGGHRSQGTGTIPYLYPILGNPLPPPGFEEWPFVAYKIGKFWEIHHRKDNGISLPISLKVGKVHYVLFKTADAVATAIARLAVEQGYQLCKEHARGRRCPNLRFAKIRA